MQSRTGATKDDNSPHSLYLKQLGPGSVLDIETENHSYRVEYLGYGAARISGHPEICPDPRLVNILGSSSGASSLEMDFIGEGLQLAFQEPGRSKIAITSPIEAIHVRDWGDRSLLQRMLPWLGRRKSKGSATVRRGERGEALQGTADRPNRMP